MENQINEEKAKLIAEVQKANLIHTSWKDYTLFLLNTADPESRNNWREKFITSYIHWCYNLGSISESNVIGLEVLSSLPSDFTNSIIDDSWEREFWYRDGRLAGSKRQKVCLGHYPQESLSNEARICLSTIVEHWEKYQSLIAENNYLKRMWEFAQKSNGNCITQDEILTYTLEKPTDEHYPAYWTDIADDIFTNGVDDYKYKDEYRNNKLPGYPFAKGKDLEWTDTADGHKLTLEEMKDNFLKMNEIILREDVSYSPSYKKIAIAILKNDKTMTYVGFSPTLKERRARTEAMKAFSTQERERNAAIKESAKLDILEAKTKK